MSNGPSTARLGLLDPEDVYVEPRSVPTFRTMYEINGEWFEVPKPLALRDTIRKELLNALAYTDGNQRFAARLLGMSERAFNYQLKLFGIPSVSEGVPLSKKPGRRPKTRVVT